METLTGTVEYIKVQLDSGFTVAEVAPDAPPAGQMFAEQATIVGVMPGLIEGLTVNLAGEWKDHPKYGLQFKVQSYITQRPSTGETMEIYLENVVGGIGPILAHAIVSQFGPTTAEVMGDPRALQEVNGIGPERAKAIAAAWLEHEHERVALEGLLAWLVQHELSPSYARKLFEIYGFNALRILEQDPYRLTELRGIGFKKADAIALGGGIAADAPERIRAALVYCLRQAALQGHCYLPVTDLVKDATVLIGPELPQIESRVNVILRQSGKAGTLIYENGCYYLPHLHRAESDTAAHLARLAAAESNMPTFRIWSEHDILKEMSTVLSYTDEQKHAVVQALKSPVSIITGGPGTGKTTIIDAVVNIATNQMYGAVLMAPTGKAAKRLSEATGALAATIHRTLGVDPQSGQFLSNEYCTLTGHLFIIDESSMLDIELAAAVLRAIPDGAHVVFVGDIDQLPSVGPGNVLKDIIASGIGPVTRLTKIWRQSEDSYIVPNAHAINRGEMPTFANGKGSDFYLFSAENGAEGADWILDLVTERIPATFGVSPADIQVLSPQKRTEAGVIALNRRLQAALNPPDPDKAEIALGNGPTARILRERDRVIQTENDYNKGIFNGDQGTIVKIGKEDGRLKLWVQIDEQIHEYGRDEFTQLWHTYALTVHKSQGSEFPVVVMPVLTDHYVMLQRNLLYTGVTRAKRLVVLVGNRRALGIALANAKVKARNSNLAMRIKAARSKEL